jgi:outer membrane protein
MKKSVFLSFTMLAAMAAGAQTKGSFMIGGSVSTQSTEQTNTSSTGNNATQTRSTLLITPRVGYFVTNNLAVGVEASFASDKNTVWSQYFAGMRVETTRTFVGGAFVRRYWPIGKAFSVFGHGGINYLDVHVRSEDGGASAETLKGSGLNVSLYPGVNYTLGRRLMIDVALRDLISLTTLNTSTPGGNNQLKSSTTSFTLGGDMSLGAGLHLLIGK